MFQDWEIIYDLVKTWAGTFLDISLKVKCCVELDSMLPIWCTGDRPMLHKHSNYILQFYTINVWKGLLDIHLHP